MGQSTGDQGGLDLSQWVDGSMRRAYLRAASTGCRTGRHQQVAAPPMCSFLRTCITHQRERHNPPGQAQEGIKRGRMHAPAATTGCRQPSLFQNIWNMHPLPRNPHVAFHIPNLGVTPQPPLHCLTLLDFLSVLAAGLASGQRNNRRRMN